MRWIKVSKKTKSAFEPTFPNFNEITEQLKKEGLLVEPDADNQSIEALVRQSIIAEIDAINLYKEIASKADGKIKEIYEHIIEEEIHHIGEFKAILNKLNPSYQMKE